MAYDYELITIGGGSGGIAVSNRAGLYGTRCLLVERDDVLGGTCVNRGCVPKKIMWYAATTAEFLRNAASYGFDVTQNGFDWSALVAARNRYIENIHGAYARYLGSNEVELRQGQARLIDAHTVQLGDERVTAERIVIAAGGRPRMLEIPGAEHAISSDGFFELESQPQRVVVIGAGYIAVELASVLALLGSKVTLAIRHERVLREFDQDIVDALMACLRDDGLEIQTEFTSARIEKRSGGLVVHGENGVTLDEADAVITAIGRVPDSEALGLDAAGVQRDKNGFIPVDQWQQTNVESIYAIGDITGQPELTPVAIAAGRRLADRLFDDQLGRRLELDIVPSVVFTHPPMASAGLSEKAARERYGEEAVGTYFTRFTAMYDALTQHRRPSAMKLVVAGPEERVVGCHLVGLAADEILQGFAVAMRMGANKRDFDDTIAIHPTSAEELVTMR